MKIVNLDAPEHLAEKVVKLEIPNFITEVVRHLERGCYVHLARHQIIRGVHSSHNTTLPLSPIWKFEDTGYENIATLIYGEISFLFIRLTPFKQRCVNN